VSKPSQVDVVGVGLNATDTLIFLPEYPSLGSKTVFRSVSVLPGGQVATTLIACQQWHLRTRYIGKLGDDYAATIHREEFARAGVETCIITVPNCASQQAFILVDGGGERTVLWQRAEQLTLQPSDLDREWIVNARALHLDGYDTAAATTAAAWARTAGVAVIADLDEVYPGIEALLENIDYLIVSRDFPARLSGEPELTKSLPLLERRFRCRLTAATLGTNGVLAWDGKRFYYACAYQVPVVDTTGAGDIFHAAFIYALVENWPVERQLEFACAAAGLNCMAAGARGNIEPVEKIESLIAGGSRHPAAWEVSTPRCAARSRRPKIRSIKS
jgi:sulfofructose kinase